MFYSCQKLDTTNSLGITNWNVEKVKNFNCMFDENEVTQEWNNLDISGWDIAESASVVMMFRTKINTKLTVYVKNEQIKNKLMETNNYNNATFIVKE